MAKEVSYLDYYSTQSGQNRFRMNELVIWAVNKLQDTKSNIGGSKAFLQKRMDYLVKDQKYHGWQKAANKLRAAVNRWVKTHTVGTPST